MQPLHKNIRSNTKSWILTATLKITLSLSLSTWFNPLCYSVYIYEIQFHKYIYFSNSLLKWLGPTLWITKPIKLISREYFISLLRDYEFHLENICSINIKCGCPTYWDFDRNYRSHSWYIKATYISWSGPLFSQDLELM